MNSKRDFDNMVYGLSISDNELYFKEIKKLKVLLKWDYEIKSKVYIINTQRYSLDKRYYVKGW